MCTCCQNRSNYCNRSSCGCGCASVGNVTTSSSCCYYGASCYNACANRCISFPVSGTAYVPVSAIRFIPNGCWNVQVGTGAISNGSSVGTSGGVSSGCGCFGRCGGAVAMANYNQDYYARQYGLND